MKAVKIISITLAVFGLLVGIYGISQLSDYRKADKAWQDASARRGDILRFRRDPSGAVSPSAVDELDELTPVVDRLGKARDGLRARTQRIVQVSIIPIALGLILGVVGLLRRPRGWMPVASTLCALAAGGLIGSMLAAGVF